MTDIKNLGKKLEEERKILIEELSNLGRVNEDTGKWEAVPIIDETSVKEADENDNADHSEDFEERTATLNVLEARLKEIDQALENIDQNKYGLCEVCGDIIEEDRLTANPSALTCKKHMN